jgi:hypothetical protein
MGRHKLDSSKNTFIRFRIEPYKYNIICNEANKLDITISELGRRAIEQYMANISHDKE